MYYDNHGNLRKYSGAYVNRPGIGSSYEQLMAGVGQFDSPTIASMKVANWRAQEEKRRQDFCAAGVYSYNPYSASIGPTVSLEPFDKVWLGWFKDFLARIRKDIKLMMDGSAKKWPRIKTFFLLPFVLLASTGLLMVTSPLALVFFVLRMAFIALGKIIKIALWSALAMIPVALVLFGLYHFKVIDNSHLMRAGIFGNFLVAKYVLNATNANWNDPQIQTAIDAQLAPYRADYIPPTLAKAAPPVKSSKKPKKKSHKTSQ